MRTPQAAGACGFRGMRARVRAGREWARCSLPALLPVGRACVRALAGVAVSRSLQLEDKTDRSLLDALHHCDSPRVKPVGNLFWDAGRLGRRARDDLLAGGSVPLSQLFRACMPDALALAHLQNVQ